MRILTAYRQEGTALDRDAGGMQGVGERIRGVGCDAIRGQGDVRRLVVVYYVISGGVGHVLYLSVQGFQVGPQRGPYLISIRTTVANLEEGDGLHIYRFHPLLVILMH